MGSVNKAEQLARKVIEAIDDSGVDGMSYSKEDYVEALEIVVDDLKLRIQVAKEELERGE